MSLIKTYITENIATRSIHQIAIDLNLSEDNVRMRVKRLPKPEPVKKVYVKPVVPVVIEEPVAVPVIEVINPIYTDMYTSYINEIEALVNYIQVKGEGVWVDIAKRKLRELELTQ